MAQGSWILGRAPGYFLNGNPGWWTPPAGPIWSKARRRDEEEEKVARTERVLASLSEREIKIQESCNNWRRQRLRPLSTSFLFPAALSPLLIAISLLFLFFGEAKGFSSEISVLFSILALAILIFPFATIRDRRIGTVKMWRSMLSAPFILIAALCIWGPLQFPEQEVILTVLLDATSAVFLISSSKAVSKEGARLLLPVSLDTKLSVLGSTINWSKGIMFNKSISPVRTIELSGEIINSQPFIVLDLLGNMDVRWDPLHYSIRKNIHNVVFSIMEENNSLANQWPEWALPKPLDEESE